MFCFSILTQNYNFFSILAYHLSILACHPSILDYGLSILAWVGAFKPMLNILP
jgi:hypothetical protein